MEQSDLEAEVRVPIAALKRATTHNDATSDLAYGVFMHVAPIVYDHEMLVQGVLALTEMHDDPYALGIAFTRNVFEGGFADHIVPLTDLPEGMPRTHEIRTGARQFYEGLSREEHGKFADGMIATLRAYPPKQVTSPTEFVIAYLRGHVSEPSH